MKPEEIATLLRNLAAAIDAETAIPQIFATVETGKNKNLIFKRLLLNWAERKEP